MEVTRTFHPVGQGAFYTERFYTGNGAFTIVYDCGSTTLSGEKLAARIRSAFPEGSEIDALFISHFHADHVNGLDILQKYCKIKTVFLPLLSVEAKALLKVAYYFDQEEELSSGLPYDRFEKLIDDPASFFAENETKVITITPLGEESSRDSLYEWVPISQITKGKTCASGIPLQPFKYINWFFIPFNYEQDKRGDLFISAIKEKGLSLGDIDTIDKIVAQKQVLKKTYASIEGDLNKNSMILFSGGLDERSCYDYVKRYSATVCGNFQISVIWYMKTRCSYFCRWDNSDIPSGCLYMGDIDLNEGDLIEDIRLRLSLFLPSLGTIQVPHHGSKHNFSHSICELGNVHLAILSFGKKNRYHHPADSVVAEILKEGVFPYLVTEDPVSILKEYIG